MIMIYIYPLLTQVSQTTYRVQYMHQIKKKEPHGPPWRVEGVYTLTLHYQYSVVLGKEAMLHSNTKGVDMGVPRWALRLSPA